MPRSAPHICNQPGCNKLTHERFCVLHKREHQSKQDKRRGSSTRRGYNYKWQKASKAYLGRHPLCAHHEKKKRIVPATIVDHIVAHKGDMNLFWDENNWQGLCKVCHDIKTATEDGGFGRQTLTG